jgi:hypothetical protein
MTYKQIVEVYDRLNNQPTLEAYMDTPEMEQMYRQQTLEQVKDCLMKCDRKNLKNNQSSTNTENKVDNT